MLRRAPRFNSAIDWERSSSPLCCSSAALSVLLAPGTLAKRAAWLVLAALALQLIIGISMVLEGFPLWLATAHNAGAAVLLMATVGLNRALRPPA